MISLRSIWRFYEKNLLISELCRSMRKHLPSEQTLHEIYPPFIWIDFQVFAPDDLCVKRPLLQSFWLAKSMKLKMICFCLVRNLKIIYAGSEWRGIGRNNASCIDIKLCGCSSKTWLRLLHYSSGDTRRGFIFGAGSFQRVKSVRE